MTVALPSALPAAGSAQAALARPRPTFPAIFHECFPLVWRLLRSLGVREPWLDDATQEVFVIVHKRLAEFDGKVRITTWIHAITYRVAANVRRRQARDGLKVELAPHDAPTTRTPEHDALAGESARFLEAFCDGLSEGMRDVFVLCFLEEWGQSEVAELLSLSPNTVSSRVRLLRRAYRDALERRQQEEARR